MIRFKTGYLPGHRATVVGLGGVLLCATAVISRPAPAAVQGCPVPPPPLTLPTQSDESTLIADQASIANGVAQAEGNVRLTRDGQTLEAPFVRYNRNSSRAQARDGLKYYRSGLYLSAADGDVNIDQRTGQFNNAHYAVTTNGARGKAAKVVALGKDRYVLTDADYSTCAGPTKAWLLSARHIELNRNTGRGVARDATMRFYGVPVLYTPYINFPIDDKRHTGLLAPTFGSSGDSGFELTTPYYINLAPNYDATLVPRLLTERGFQLGAQFRYLGAHQRGEFDGEYLPHDRKYGADRSLVHFQHVGRFNPYVGIRADYSRVSDDDYFDDLSNDLAHTSTSQLERALRLTVADTGVRFSLLAQDFQTLSDTHYQSGSGIRDTPYKRLPQARLEALSPTAPFQIGIDAGFTNFQRSGSVNAYRTDLRPRLLWGVDHGGWYANSEAAYRYTRYNLRDLDNSSANAMTQPRRDVINRSIPSFKLGSGLRFSRLLHNGWIQTLDPRVQYLYTGYENQSDIPVFDTGSTDLRYDSLFADNRFTGIDRIGDANQITLGITSRFIEPASGRTVLKLDFGRVTSFRDLRVEVPYAGTTGYTGHGSNYVAGIQVRPNDHISARTTLQYDPHDSRLNRAIATASYATSGGYRFDIGYRLYRDFRPLRRTYTSNGSNVTQFIPGRYETLEQTSLGLRAPVTASLDVLARWNYSLERSQNVETLFGFEYRPSCCWAGRVAVRRYVAHDDGSQDTAIMFQFVLNGLGRFGDSIQTFVSNDVFSNDTTGHARGSFDTIR